MNHTYKGNVGRLLFWKSILDGVIFCNLVIFAIHKTVSSVCFFLEHVLITVSELEVRKKEQITRVTWLQQWNWSIKLRISCIDTLIVFYGLKQMKAVGQGCSTKTYFETFYKIQRNALVSDCFYNIYKAARQELVTVLKRSSNIAVFLNILRTVLGQLFRKMSLSSCFW